jgi:hypothetical protein
VFGPGRPGLPRDGGVPEWLKGTDCKSVGYAYAGSNPAPSTIHKSVIHKSVIHKSVIHKSVIQISAIASRGHARRLLSRANQDSVCDTVAAAGTASWT